MIKNITPSILEIEFNHKVDQMMQIKSISEHVYEYFNDDKGKHLQRIKAWWNKRRIQLDNERLIKTLRVKRMCDAPKYQSFQYRLIQGAITPQ